MKRSSLAVLLVASVFSASVWAAPERAIGGTHAEIRLSDGTVFKNARVLDASRERRSVTISDGRQVRTFAQELLPAALREQVAAELAQGYTPRYNVYREARPAPPADKVIPPPAPAENPHSPAHPATMTDRLVERATAEAADELKLYLLKSHDRSLASLTTKVRQAAPVPGWPKIRVSGEASYSVWDNFRRDYVWRTEKFEVDFAIVAGTSLKPDRVSFGGISRPVEID